MNSTGTDSDYTFDSTEGPRENGFRIGSLNICSLTDRLEHVKGLLRKHKFDVFVIIESRLSWDGAAEKYEIPGYTAVNFPRTFKKNEKSENADEVTFTKKVSKKVKWVLVDTETERSAGNKPGGGVLVYIKNSECQVEASGSDSESDSDSDIGSDLWEEQSSNIQICRIQRVRTQGSQPLKFNLYAVYNPNKSNYETCCNKLKSLFEKDRKAKERVVCVGDFNDNPIHEIFGKKFRQLINSYTRLDFPNSTCIDHIYADYEESDILESGVVRYAISDHDLIYCTVNCTRPDVWSEPETWLKSALTFLHKLKKGVERAFNEDVGLLAKWKTMTAAKEHVSNTIEFLDKNRLFYQTVAQFVNAEAATSKADDESIIKHHARRIAVEGGMLDPEDVERFCEESVSSAKGKLKLKNISKFSTTMTDSYETKISSQIDEPALSRSKCITRFAKHVREHISKKLPDQEFVVIAKILKYPYASVKSLQSLMGSNLIPYMEKRGNDYQIPGHSSILHMALKYQVDELRRDELYGKDSGIKFFCSENEVAVCLTVGFKKRTTTGGKPGSLIVEDKDDFQSKQSRFIEAITKLKQIGKSAHTDSPTQIFRTVNIGEPFQKQLIDKLKKSVKTAATGVDFLGIHFTKDMTRSSAYKSYLKTMDEIIKFSPGFTEIAKPYKDAVMMARLSYSEPELEDFFEDFGKMSV